MHLYIYYRWIVTFNLHNLMIFNWLSGFLKYSRSGTPCRYTPLCRSRAVLRRAHPLRVLFPPLHQRGLMWSGRQIYLQAAVAGCHGSARWFLLVGVLTDFSESGNLKNVVHNFVLLFLRQQCRWFVFMFAKLSHFCSWCNFLKQSAVP